MDRITLVHKSGSRKSFIPEIVPPVSSKSSSASPSKSPSTSPSPAPAPGGSFVPPVAPGENLGYEWLRSSEMKSWSAGVVVPDGPMIYSMPDYVSRNGKNHPATRGPINLKFFRLMGDKRAQAWGDYIIRLFCLLHPQMVQWNSDGSIKSQSTEWWSNFKGFWQGGRAWDNGHGYSSGEWAVANLFAAGATFRIVDDTIRTYQGRRWMKAIGMDYMKSPPKLDTLSDVDMSLHFMSTTATAIGNNPFPQFGGRTCHPCFGAEYTAEGVCYNWVDIDGYVDRPGPMIRVESVGHPFVKARWDLTKDLIE